MAKLQSLTEKFWMRLAWLMPRALVYWCAIRLGAHATQDEYSWQIVPELLFIDALKRWDGDQTGCPVDQRDR